MTINKKQAGLIAGLVCLILVILLLLTMCGRRDEDPPTDMTEPTVTETTSEPTDETQESTEATEEPEATDPTEETTGNTSTGTTGGSTRPGGTGGYNPGTDSDDSTDETVPAETYPAAGSEGSPYLESVVQLPDEIKTVVLPEKETVHYTLVVDQEMAKVYNGFCVMVEEDAYIVYGDKTYKPENGVVTLPLTVDDQNAGCFDLQIGSETGGQATFKLNYPLGHKDNPHQIKLAENAFSEEITFPMTQTDGYYYQLKPDDSGRLTATVAHSDYSRMTFLIGDREVYPNYETGILSEDLKKDDVLSIHIVPMEITEEGIEVPESVTFSISGTMNYTLGDKDDPELLDVDDYGSVLIQKSLEENDTDGYYYHYTPSDECTVKLELTEITEGVAADILVTVGETTVKLSESAADPAVAEIPVAAGQQFLVQVITLPAEEGGVNPAADLTIMGTLEYPLGSQKNPIEIIDTFPIVTDVLKPGDKVYYRVFGAGGGNLTAEDPDIRLTIDGVIVEPDENGLIAYPVPEGNPRQPVEILVESTSEEEVKSFTLDVTYPLGSMKNMATLVEGDNTAIIEEGNANGYWFTWKSQSEGTLVLTMPNDSGWMYQIQNITTGVYGDIQWSDSEPVQNPVTIPFAAGNELNIMVNTYDPENPAGIPAGELTVRAKIEGPVGTEHNPQVLTAPITEITVGAKKTYYCSVIFDDVTMQVSTNSSMVVVTYDGTKYNKLKKVTIKDISASEEAPKLLAISNSSTTDRNYTITFTNPDGTAYVPASAFTQVKPQITETEFTGTYEPQPFQLAQGEAEKLVYADLTKTPDLYHAPEQGLYYHYDTGAAMYVDLSSDTFVNIKKLLETESLYWDTTAEDGSITREVYNGLLEKYIANAHVIVVSETEEETIEKTLYPMTDDLVYMLIRIGDQLGWYKSDSEGYLFADVTDAEADYVWMFPCCWAETPATGDSVTEPAGTENSATDPAVKESAAKQENAEPKATVVPQQTESPAQPQESVPPVTEPEEQPAEATE